MSSNRYFGAGETGKEKLSHSHISAFSQSFPRQDASGPGRDLEG
jgi:hypothetical protein